MLACRLNGDKPFSEPKLSCYCLDLWEQISVFDVTIQIKDDILNCHSHPNRWDVRCLAWVPWNVIRKFKLDNSQQTNCVMNIITTSNGRFGVIIMYLLRTLFAGLFSFVDAVWNTIFNLTALTQWTHDVIITSSLRQNDVATSFWRNNDVIIILCVCWVTSTTDYLRN